MGIEKPKISVIIPCYNCETFIARAIKSVLDQTFEDWELILVNNNSTDATQQILENYEKEFPSKITVFQEMKKGAPAARNKGLMHAKGEWIQFLDADDELLPEKIKGQYQLTSTNPSIVASPYTMEGEREGSAFTKIRKLEIADFWKGLTISELGITSANLWNRKILLTAGGWDETLVSSQEYDLMFRMLQNSPKVAFDDRNLTIIHIGSEESVSRGGGEEKRRNILDSRVGLRLRIRNHLQQMGILTKERSKSIDEFIYFQLIYGYRFRPDYVTEKFRAIALRIPLKLRLKGQYFMWKMDIKRLLKIK